MEKKTLNVAAISFTVALGSLGLFSRPFLIVRVLCLFLNKITPEFSSLIFYSALFAPLPSTVTENHLYSAGITNNVSSVDVTNPPITTVANGR